MMPVYRANQGDCMSSISQHFGFSWQTLWDLKDNAALRAQRQHPNVLMPGDEVFIPDKRLREESCVTTQSHLFRLKGVPCRLNVVFLDERSNPRAGLRYTVVVDGTSSKGVTSPEGLLTTLVPPDADLANITIVNEDGEQESYQMRLAYLNPVSDNSGVEDRLKNLGYFKGGLTGGLNDESKAALKRFQKANGLPVTGEPDPETKDALLARHGS
jgi:hypothetical protein